ncbi:DUF6233 domain-containing protein [Streptomyces sp. NPDC004362]|uniref:DUF6233 domain-containing protein n=1 Tax=Streptomyces sp. NPDC004362 TaxID=3154456 RepID=UPI0033B078F4
MAEGGQRIEEQLEPAPRPSRPPGVALPQDSVGFKIAHRQVEGGPLLASLHLGDCDFDEGEKQCLDAHEAAVALADGLAACVVCRPDAVLR